MAKVTAASLVPTVGVKHQKKIVFGHRKKRLFGQVKPLIENNPMKGGIIVQDFAAVTAAIVKKFCERN